MHQQHSVQSFRIGKSLSHISFITTQTSRYDVNSNSKKEGIFALLVMGITILSIIVIIKPYAGIIIIPVLFYGVTLILTGVLSFIICSKNKTPQNRNLILGYIFICLSAVIKAIEIIYFNENYYFFWNPLLYALGHYYFYLYFTHKSKHNHAI